VALQERFFTMLQHAWKLPLLEQLERSDPFQFPRGVSHDVDWGYFDSREEAELFLRPTNSVAYNNDNTRNSTINSCSRVQPYDYAAMFFLQRLAKEGKLKVVTDLAGRSGLKYTSYRKYIDFPGDFVWQIVGHQTGRLDQERLCLMNNGILRFYENAEDTEPCSALICSGALPYLDMPFEQKLGSLPTKPPVVVLNEVSASEKAGFYMVESFGASRVLHKVMALTEIEQVRKSLGYKLVSRWDIPERSFVLGTLNDAQTVQMIGEVWSL
jgi:putative methyltransferase (TIGR04325 family)